MTNAASPRSVERQRKRSAEDARGTEYTLQNIMSHPQGRRWIWLQLSHCRIYQASENLDPAILAWREGLRNYGLQLLTDVIRYCPNDYVRMTNENSSANLEETPDDRDSDDT